LKSNRANAARSSGGKLDDPAGLASYTPADHAVWETLFERQVRMPPGRMVPEDRVYTRGTQAYACARSVA